MDKIKLTYFDINGGRAEPTRILMAIAGIKFEDHRVSFTEFRDMRESTPLNAVPVLAINGVDYTQCNAMNRYYGKQAGLYPTDPWQAFLCDEVLEIIEDMIIALNRTLGMQDEEQKSARQKLADGLYTRCLQTLDQRLKAAGGEFFSNQSFTVADIKVYLWIKHLRSGGIEHVPADLMEQIAPRLVQYMERVAAQPGLVAYYEGRGN